jgi:hypothetical protein
MGLKREFLESLALTAEPQRLGMAVSFLKVAIAPENGHSSINRNQSQPASRAMSPSVQVSRTLFLCD